MPQPTPILIPSVQIVIINESTVLTEAEIAPVVAALQSR
jgi:hypothetical protein